MKKKFKVSVQNPTTGEILHGEGKPIPAAGDAKGDMVVWDITLLNGWKMKLTKEEALVWKLQTK